MKYGKLTLESSGKYALPLVEIFDAAPPIIMGQGEDKITWGSETWKIWDGAALWEKGYAFIDINPVPDDMEVLSYEDKKENGRVRRSFKTKAIPQPPAPVKTAEQQVREKLGKERGKTEEDLQTEGLIAMLRWFDELDNKKAELRTAIQNIRVGPDSQIMPGPAQSLIEAMEPLLIPPSEVKSLMASYRRAR